MTVSATIQVLETLRRAEKEQTLTYRSLAARAETAGDGALAQRFHDLHADEQHHLSRITARILELGGHPADLHEVRPADGSLESWAEEIRTREQREIDRYRDVLANDFDPETRSLLEEILTVESKHLAELGGKWVKAS